MLSTLEYLRGMSVFISVKVCVYMMRDHWISLQILTHNTFLKIEPPLELFLHTVPP